MTEHTLSTAIAVIRDIPTDLTSTPTTELLTTLRRHGLLVLFRKAVQRGRLALPADLDAALALAHRDATLRVLLQERALTLIGEALAGKAWCLWRGLHLARLLYDEPSERVGVDIDILVAPRQRDATIRALERMGFGLHTDPRNLTHEVSLVGHGVGIDLHWHVVRPGRAANDLTSWMLSQTTARDSIDVLGDTATLVMLLLHTALSEHVTGRLIRALDIDRLLRRVAVDWRAALEIITSSGLKSAAWATLTWTRSVFDTPVPDEVLQRLAPNRAHKSYLSTWLARDPAALYPKAPVLVRGAFSLALHDDVWGATRAVLTLARARLAAMPMLKRDRHAEF